MSTTLMKRIDRLTAKFAGQELCETCAVEELAELIQAIQHTVRARPANLAEEMAHVTIMLESLRKKYAVSTAEIMFYENNMCDRYLNDKEWDGSHNPAKILYHVVYTRKGKFFKFTTNDYANAVVKMAHLRKQKGVTIESFFPSDANGNTPNDISTLL